MRRPLLLLALTASLLAMPLLAAPPPAPAQSAPPALSIEDEAERRWLTESGQYLLEDAGIVQKAASAPALAEALDVPPSQLTDAAVSGPAAGTAVFAGLGVVQPKRGETFGFLSTGVAGTASPEPGTDFSPFGPAGDSLTLTLSLEAPPGSTRLSFDFNFLSAEFPDFVGSVFNDTFTATLTDAAGTRQIAFASVNSSFFFAASSSRAGGTGFDIFTEDPSGVDTSFGGGLPDAGLTDWQAVEVPIAGGGPLTLQLGIRDLGDGILDSSVILDNLVITSLEAVDPNPDLLSGSEVTTDPERLATGGEPVDGAAADGVTRVLLRTTVPGPGQVEFSLEDAGAPEDGGLSVVGGTDRLDTVLVPVEETSEGFQAFAAYLVPEEFDRGGDAGLAERPLGFKASFLPDDGEALEAELPFRLVRPPVVLVHGLWSSAGTWTFPLVTDPRFDSTLADYAATNASRFATNGLVPFDFIREALTAQRNRRIAATRVDVAGHSMGGILSRNHVSLPIYARPVNFDQGDLNKLLTLNTPHTGSPLANLIVTLRDGLPGVVSGFLVDRLRDVGLPIDEGAIDDLSTGSPAIDAIEQTPVPAHALVGIGGSDLTGDALALAGGQIGVLFKVLNFLDDTSDLFAGIQHDFIVGRRSQEGGLPSRATTIFDGLESVHVRVTSSSRYSDRVIELFNSPADGPEFAELPAPATLALATESALVRKLQTVQAVVPGGLEIASPADGAGAVAGSPVTVTVEARNGFDLQRVLVVSAVEGLELDQAPFTGNFPLPIEAVGDVELIALGIDGEGNLSASEPVTLTVSAPAALEAVTVVNRDPILFGTGATRQLYVAGRYADGVIRDLTDPSTGTEYLSSGPSIAAVSPDGVVTATGLGVATVVARNGSFQDSVSVTTLQQANEPPVIVDLSADPALLWPPNHKMVPVTLTVEATDDTDPAPACAISGVTSNEPVDGDFEVTGDLTVDLRAERLGQGEGRVYDVEVTCSDSAGASVTATVEVVVAHDQRR